MNKIAMPESQEQILEMFQKLIAERHNAIRVASKQDEIEKQKNQELLERAGEYTVDNIVKSLADLQLDFGGIVNNLAVKLTQERDKVEELKKAIAVETQHFQELKSIRLAADALYIFDREHQERLRLLETDAQRQKEELDQEIARTRKNWEREQAEKAERLQQELEMQQKQRQQEAEEYAYKLELTRQRIADANAANKAALEIELQETNEFKTKNWREREAILKANKAELEQNQKQIEASKAELEEAIKKAREEAIKEVHKEARTKAELFEKEWQGSKQAYEYHIQSLEQKIAKQLEQIQNISTQLESVMKQAQGLAMRALDTSANKLSVKGE